MRRPTGSLVPRRVARHRNPQLLGSGVLLALVGVVAVRPQLFTSQTPDSRCDLTRSAQPPSASHPFGLDVLGCDYLTQTVYAARTSMLIALLVVGLTLTVALVLGSLAGFLGGWVDVLVSRVTDVWSGIPLILGGVVLLSTTETRGVLQVAAVLAVFGWPPMVRLLRTSVMSTREADYVAAARALGASRWRVLRRHVLPSSLRPVLTLASASAGAVIATEATLTFAGVGLQRPTVSWGILLFNAQDRIGQAPHLLVFPAAFLVVTVLAFVLLGEALRRSSSLAETARR